MPGTPTKFTLYVAAATTSAGPQFLAPTTSYEQIVREFLAAMRRT
jgi:hypothetical protein